MRVRVRVQVQVQVRGRGRQSSRGGCSWRSEGGEAIGLEGAIIKGTQHLFDDKRLRGCNLWRGLNFINLARHSPEGVLRGTLETAEYQCFNFTI